MKLTSHLPPADRQWVEGRLRSNLIAWLTTVRPDGQPVTVPVWFLLRDDGTILVYSRPEGEAAQHRGQPEGELRAGHDRRRPQHRAPGGHRQEGPDQPPAHEHPAYLAKHTGRMAAMFGTPEQFATLFSAAVIITPANLHT